MQGTAVVVVPVGSVTYKGQKIVYHEGKVGTVAQELYTTLTDLQAERTPDKLGWLLPVDC